MEGPRVLIISDLPELRLQLRELLREDSYEVYEVAACVDAEIYRQRVGPRVILVDLDISSDDPLAFLEELKRSASGGLRLSRLPATRRRALRNATLSWAIPTFCGGLPRPINFALWYETR